MTYFNNFVSNSLAGTGNQLWFTNENPDLIQKGRLFYKIFKGGRYNYSLLFSNIIDSTFADGTVSTKNIVCDEWYIENLKIAICDDCNCNTMVQVTDFIELTFDQKSFKVVHPGEFFSTDPVELNIKDGQYLCIEISFRGRMIPYHHEIQIPTFSFDNGEWIPSNLVPVPSMIGCDRKVDNRIAFFGDSITQGIGAPINSYKHWNACLAEKLGTKNSYWNLGIGYGRADDAASNGAWLYKAKQNDIVFVCFGVNDISKGFSEQEIKNNLKFIIDKLKQCGIRIILQTIPPFNYDDKKAEIWRNVNLFIKNELVNYCDFVYDVVPILGHENERSHFAKYGGHPNAEGCKLWADDLFELLNGKI